MRILVAYATRHGATQGIAERIAATLQRTGLDVTLTPVDQAAAPSGMTRSSSAAPLTWASG